MFSAIIGIQSAYTVRKLFYISMDTTGFNIETGKFNHHNFFLFSQNDFWLYPSHNKKHLILCSEYIYFGYKTPLALPAMFALLSLDVKITSLGLISSSTLHAHKIAVRIAPHSTLPENISSAKKVRYKPQSVHIKWSRHLPKRLRLLTPAGNSPCRHCISKDILFSG